MLRKSAREDPTFGTRVFVTSADRADTRRTLDSESEQQRCRHAAWAFGFHMTPRQVILWSRVVQRDKPIPQRSVWKASRQPAAPGRVFLRPQDVNFLG